jgi:hypothetical protein
MKPLRISESIILAHINDYMEIIIFTLFFFPKIYLSYMECIIISIRIRNYFLLGLNERIYRYGMNALSTSVLSEYCLNKCFGEKCGIAIWMREYKAYRRRWVCENGDILRNYCGWNDFSKNKTRMICSISRHTLLSIKFFFVYCYLIMVTANLISLSCSVLCCSTKYCVLRIARLNENVIGDPIPLAASSKARICGLSLTGRMSPTSWGLCECCVSSGRGLCDELITRPEDSCRVWWGWVWFGSTVKEEVMTRIRTKGPQKKEQYNWLAECKRVSHIHDIYWQLSLINENKLLYCRYITCNTTYVSFVHMCECASCSM